MIEQMSVIGTAESLNQIFTAHQSQTLVTLDFSDFRSQFKVHFRLFFLFVFVLLSGSIGLTTGPTLRGLRLSISR